MTISTREIPYPDIDIDAVRKYVNGRANRSSVREMARRIGIGNSSLDKFLNGSEPYARNRAKLCEWYLREHRVHPVPQTMEVPLEAKADDPETHLDALLGELRGGRNQRFPAGRLRKRVFGGRFFAGAHSQIIAKQRAWDSYGRARLPPSRRSGPSERSEESSP